MTTFFHTDNGLELRTPFPAAITLDVNGRYHISCDSKDVRIIYDDETHELILHVLPKSRKDE